MAEIQKLRTTQHCGNTCIFIRTGGKSHFHPSRSGRTQHWRIQPYGQGGRSSAAGRPQGNVAPLPQPNRGAVQSLQIGRNFRASPVQAGVSAGVKTGTGRAGRRCCHRLRRNRVRRSCNVRHGAQQQAAGHKDRRHCGQPLSQARGASQKHGAGLAKNYFLVSMVCTIFRAIGLTRSRRVSSIRLSAALPEGRPVRD